MLFQRSITGFLLAFCLYTLPMTPPAYAVTEAGLSSSCIEIAPSSLSGKVYTGIIRLQGSSKLAKVWFCLKGPCGEVVIYPAEVTDTRYDVQVCLRFGPGRYTLWAGDNPARFDGSLRFEIINTSADNRYLTPSAFVDSEHPAVEELVKSLAGEEMGDYSKLQLLYNWVVNNITYDYQSYHAGLNRLTTASTILKSRTGLCRDYSFLLAALCRKAGLPARVVYGMAEVPGGGPVLNHAWNEVLIGQHWVIADAAWDCFDPPPEEFFQTHRLNNITLH